MTSTSLLNHLSRRLKWAFLIACRPSIRLSVNSSHFNLLLHNHWAKFNQTWHKASLGGGDSNLFKWRATSFYKADNSENVKLYWKYLKIFSRSNRPISTKLDIKHPWVEGIQICHEDPHPFPRADNSENVKLYWKYLKIFFSRTTGPISTKFSTKHPWVEENSFLFKWKAMPFSKWR